MIDTNNGKLLWKSAGLYQMIERRYYEALGQIPPSTEDDQSCGRRRTTGTDLCHGRCGFGRDRCHGIHLPTWYSTVGRRMTRLGSCSMFASLGRPSNQIHSTATRFNILYTAPWERSR